ncbi:MAG: type II toxin-antitoxin system RatA family toxin [Pseudomonadota bacterium]
MSHVTKSVLVPYTAAEMFDLVDRVEAYSEFLPWCGGTELHRRDESVTEATIHIRYMQVQQRFTTENRKRFPEVMQLTLKDGPFRKLEGAWYFKPLGEEGSRVELLLHYEFASHLLEKVVGPVFGLIANNLVDAFVQRAEKVYGAR